MTTLTPTKDKGATTKVAPFLYAEDGCLVTDDVLDAQMRIGDGLNVPFIADFLSGMLTHERCGTHLYRSVENRSNNPMLMNKYREFGAETQRHTEILETLIARCGGNPNYVSPTARVVEATDSKLLESTFLSNGTLDPMTAEMGMLDAVFLAESMDHANWAVLAELTQALPKGEIRDEFQAAVDEVLAQEDTHLTWATKTKQRLVILEAKSSLVADMGQKAETLVARVQNWLSE